MFSGWNLRDSLYEHLLSSENANDTLILLNECIADWPQRDQRLILIWLTSILISLDRLEVASLLISNMKQSAASEIPSNRYDFVYQEARLVFINDGATSASKLLNESLVSWKMSECAMSQDIVLCLELLFDILDNDSAMRERFLSDLRLFPKKHMAGLAIWLQSKANREVLDGRFDKAGQLFNCACDLCGLAFDYNSFELASIMADRELYYFRSRNFASLDLQRLVNYSCILKDHGDPRWLGTLALVQEVMNLTASISTRSEILADFSKQKDFIKFQTESIVQSLVQTFDSANLIKEDLFDGAHKKTPIQALRSQEFSTALGLLSLEIYPQGDSWMDPDVRWSTLANYATALLFLGRISDARDILAKIHQPHPYVARLRQSVAEWEKTQTIGAKLGRLFGGKPAQPYQFPSDLEPGVGA